MTMDESEIKTRVLALLCGALRGHSVSIIRQMGPGEYQRGEGVSVGSHRSVLIADIFNTIVKNEDYVILTKDEIFTASEINSLDVNLEYGYDVDGFIETARKARKDD